MQSKRILLPLLAVLLIGLLAGMSCISAMGATANTVDFEVQANVSASDAVAENPLIVSSGAELTVSVVVNNNAGVNSAQFELQYDPNAVEIVMNGTKPAYTTHDDVFSADAYSITVSTPDAETVKVIYFADGNSDVTATGAWIDFTFKVKAGYHGDIHFNFTEVFAITSASYGFGKGVEGYAGVHDFVDAPKVEEATCTTDGTKTYHCNTCQEDVKITTDLALSHNLTAHEAKAVTCTEDGNLAYWSCDRCNKSFSDEAATTEVNAADMVLAHPGHDWVITPGKPATCTETGLTEGKACGREGCGVVESEQTVIEATGHDWVTDSEGKHCNNCQLVIPNEGEEPSGSLTWLWILLAVLVVAGAGVAAYFLIYKKPSVKKY